MSLRAHETVNRKRGPKGMSREIVLAIYHAKGPQKNVAADFGVSIPAVCLIKNGKRHAEITGHDGVTAAFNAALISLACGAV